jgi:hypothetical protein
MRKAIPKGVEHEESFEGPLEEKLNMLQRNACE